MAVAAQPGNRDRQPANADAQSVNRNAQSVNGLRQSVAGARQLAARHRHSPEEGRDPVDRRRHRLSVEVVFGCMNLPLELDVQCIPMPWDHYFIWKLLNK